MPETDSGQYPRIYRAIGNKRWFRRESRTVDSAAFKLRSTDEGISLLKDVTICSREFTASPLRDCFGEFVLETEQVRQLGLRVEDDEPDDPAFSENHAEIKGIPVNPRTDEDKLLAEDFATDLAALSSLHYDRFQTYTA